MSLDIVQVYSHEQPVPTIYLFEFSDGEYIALQRNVSNRLSEKDGALYSAWFATDGEITNNPDKADVSDIPSKLESHDIYWNDSEGDGEEYTKAINDLV